MPTVPRRKGPGQTAPALMYLPTPSGLLRVQTFESDAPDVTAARIDLFEAVRSIELSTVELRKLVVAFSRGRR